MRSSPWLQRKFDQSADRAEIKAKLKRIKDDIDPAFRVYFKWFKKDLLSILDERPSAANDNIANQQLDILTDSLRDARSRNNIKLWDAMLDDLDKAA